MGRGPAHHIRRHPMRINRSITLIAAASMLSAGAVATVSMLAPSAASAIPTPQRACGSPELTLNGGTGGGLYHSTGLSVTVIDGIPLGPGTHTLTPEFRLSGNATSSGIVDRLCVVAEANTK